MNCKTHDPPGALIHDDHDPVTTQEQRFADSADYGAPRTMKRLVLVPGIPVEQTSLYPRVSQFIPGQVAALGKPQVAVDHATTHCVLTV